jgi:hypothetical protein
MACHCHLTKPKMDDPVTQRGLDPSKSIIRLINSVRLLERVGYQRVHEVGNDQAG